MSRIRNIAVVGVTSLSALALAMPSAFAATTTIHSGSTSGPAYAGGVVATNLGNVTVSTSLGGASCSSSTMTGTINSDGTGLSVSAATFGGCTGPLGSVTVTAQSLPWNGGSVVYGPVPGGEDGTITLANFSVKANFSGINCTYGGTLSGPGYNADNTARPDTTVDQAQAKINAATVSKTSGSFLCPGTATVTAAYQLVGSGGEQLWATS